MSSSVKRLVHDPKTFGYVFLYICMMPMAHTMRIKTYHARQTAAIY